MLLLVDRLCEENTRSYSSFSVVGVAVETPFLPSFRYINCIITIADTVFIDYHFLSYVICTFHFEYKFLLNFWILDS